MNEYEEHLLQDDSVSIKSNFEINRLDINHRPIDDGNLPDYLRYEAEVDLHEKCEWISRDVEELREMILMEPNLKSRIDKPFLLSFLRARKFDYDKAMNMIRKYYRSRQNNKDLYVNLLPSTLSSIFNIKIHTVLTKPDYQGRTVILFITEAWNPDTVSFDELLQTQILTLEHIVRLPITQLKGVNVVVDCKGLSFNHIHYLTPSNIKLMVSIIQEVFPLRFKALHFVREPSIFEWAFSLVRPFLTDTIKSRLHFHGENIAGLHSHIPTEILPEQFGGTDGPLDNTELVKSLFEQEEYFKDHFSYGYDNEPINGSKVEQVPVSSSVKNTVAGIGHSIGSYYRRMCFE